MLQQGSVGRIMIEGEERLLTPWRKEESLLTPRRKEECLLTPQRKEERFLTPRRNAPSHLGGRRNASSHLGGAPPHTLEEGGMPHHNSESSVSWGRLFLVLPRMMGEGRTSSIIIITVGSLRFPFFFFGWLQQLITSLIVSRDSQHYYSTDTCQTQH